MINKNLKITVGIFLFFISFLSLPLKSDDLRKLTDPHEYNFYLINIWSSWCIPCRSEHNYLIKLKKQNLIKLVGINYKDNFENAKKFLDELENPYSKIIKDKNGTISIELGAYGVPETFIIDKRKKIIKKITGPINEKIYNEILLIIK